MEKLVNGLKIAIENAQVLAVSLSNAVNHASSVTKDAEAKIKVAEDKEAVNKAKSEDIAMREANVAKVENVIAIEAANKDLIKQVGEKAKRVAEATLAVQQIRQEADRVMRKNADDKVLLNNGWAQLKKKESELKARENDYKERIAKSIVSNVKG